MQEVLSTAQGERISRAEYGSDLVAEMLRALDIPYVSLNPGASYRGIHDSFVNFEGGGPEMIVSCHEEIAVAVAHGWARVTGKPLAAGLHDVVGLQHAAMAIYHAWCARLPMIIIGGTGPMATENRRPNTDWLHTALVQGNQVRDYVKWDDQPATPQSIPESILRAYKIAMTEPKGPVYLCFDTDLQEEPLPAPIMLPDPQRFQPPAPLGPDPAAIDKVAQMLAGAQYPVIVAGAVARHREALPPLLELAEMLSAPVVANGYAIPTTHPLYATSSRQEVLGEADVVLALDVLDLFGAFSQTGGIKDRGVFPQYIKPTTKVVHISIWDLLQHSWSTDFQRLYPVDVPIAANTAVALPLLVEATRKAMQGDSSSTGRADERRRAIEAMQAKAAERREANLRRGWDARPITVNRLNAELWSAVKGKPWATSGPRPGWEVTDPDQVPNTGAGGGSAGLGLSLGTTIGAALAIKDSGRFTVHVSGDGEFLYTPSTLWTLANLNLPVLAVINNNRLYGNDEGHQEFIARTRGRAVENKYIGISLDGPQTDLAGIARSFGIEGIGPITDPDELPAVFERAVRIVMDEKRPVLVDVITQNE